MGLSSLPVLKMEEPRRSKLPEPLATHCHPGSPEARWHLPTMGDVDG